MEKTRNRVKLCRLRDIVLYHLQKANKNVTMGDLDALEDDIKVWTKNFIMTIDTHAFTGVVLTSKFKQSLSCFAGFGSHPRLHRRGALAKLEELDVCPRVSFIGGENAFEED